ncbi:SusC/RagA family TonB-linked outer membrane protein [Robertkochia flava]|uniref:SusC/RagA family TonB-linked outer membrane protein n=1 Tax=Robertkochia flava TaxID=3447986 RepID=UPI001CD02736|nr:SusC/RagA family TonB-linked outer membrane protein [Robertkochia marina]
MMQFTFAQEKTITGVITDQMDMPLPGANVMIKGTTTGTQTDFDGNYSINASEGDVLVYSYIGQKTEERTVGAQTVMDVKLVEDAQALEEVIVVGYGTSTKQSFTGTAKQIDAASLEKKSVSNVSQALAGEAAGVRVINTSGQPGTAATIRIRGFGSVNGNRDPLYIVDGVPYTGNINALNPSDIESTTILKDASATAIYGARGANGVVVIKTKSGVRQDSYVEVEARTGFNLSLLPRYSTLDSPEEYIGLTWESIYNRGVATGAADPVAFANNRLFSSSGIDPDYNMWNVANGAELIDPVTGMVRDGVSRKYNPEDWEDYAFQSSDRTEANLRIGGGNENTQYYTSFGYLKDVGYIINSDFERLTARLNVNHQAKDWLHGSMNIGYTLSETNNNGQSSDSGSVFWFVDNIPSIYPLFVRDENGEIVQDPIYGGGLYDYGEAGRGFGALTNSIADATNSLSRSNKHEINTNASLDIIFSDHLKLENRIGAQYYNDSYDGLDNPFYGPSASQGGSIFKRKLEFFSYNILNLLRYNNRWGEHSFDALIAHEANSWEQKYLSGYKFNLVDPDGEEFNNAVGSNPPESFTSDFTLESFFGQANYNFRNTYFLSTTIRRDGSSRFLNNKWGTFGSVGAAWVASNEDFIADIDWITNLKLKTSYGLIGEQGGVGYYPGYDLFALGSLDGNPALIFDTKGNPDLTWETSKMFQTGVEMSISNRVDVNLDYYRKNTDDLIFERRVGPSLGYALIQVNDGSLLNQGLEFDVSSTLLKGDDYFVTLGVNGEVLKNEITEMPIDPATGEPKVIDVQGRFGLAEGKSIYDFYMREWAGVDTQTGVGMWNLYYYDADGSGDLTAGEQIPSLFEYTNRFPERAGDIQKTTTTRYTEATQKYVNKSAIPDVRGAFTLSAGWKGFELSTQFLYSLGGYSYDFVYASLMDNHSAGGNNWHTDIRDRWQQPGDVTDVPRISDNYDINVGSTSTRFLTKADYLALNNIRLGYTLPSSVIENLGVSSLNLYMTGDNLWLSTKRKGFNPTTSQAGTSDWYTYNPLSTFTFGLRAKF